MEDFDTLRHRVEETAERLSSAQSERQEETHALIGMLSQLEEKYSAQEQQFSYYRNRLEPLEQANAQLTSLMENLLDLIDSGFGEGSLGPLRKASAMASAMLATEVSAMSDTPSDQPALSDSDDDGEMEIALSHAEPEMATLDDIEEDGETEAVSGIEEDVQVVEDLVELIEESSEIADEPADTQSDEIGDLELEEEPLCYLDEDIEVASDDVGAEIDAIAAADMAEPVTGEDAASAVELVAEDEFVAIDDMTDAQEPDLTIRFEDVSDAVLELESEEDAAAGFDELPEIVKDAAAAFASNDDAAPIAQSSEDVTMIGEEGLVAAAEIDIDTEAASADDPADEAETIAALAQAMEEETSTEDAAPPEPSDIRSLLLRVEALAKKAEAMRLAQGADMEMPEEGETAVDEQGAGAAVEKDEKGSEAAA